MFKPCPIVLNYLRHIFTGGASPPSPPLVTGLHTSASNPSQSFSYWFQWTCESS